MKKRNTNDKYNTKHGAWLLRPGGVVGVALGPLRKSALVSVLPFCGP